MAFTLTPRLTTMTAQWAKTARTDIPVPPIPGVAYRNTSLPVPDIENGQAYDKVYDSARHNEMLHQATGMALESATYGLPRYSEFTNYEAGGLCLGLDGALCQALQQNGPSIGGVGVKPTTDTAYWLSVPLDTLKNMNAFLTAPPINGVLYGIQDGSWAEIDLSVGDTGGGEEPGGGNYAPRPVDGGGEFSGTELGVWRGLSWASDGMYLPSGGRWAFFYIPYRRGAGDDYDNIVTEGSRMAGVLPGGTRVSTVTVEQYNFAFGICWRVA